MRIVPATEEAIAQAARHLREGRLVGMPTETVYGVAANATDPAAVRATFEVKGRPADNPLIVHLADAGSLDQVAAAPPPLARALAGTFWPGPLTLVIRKAAGIPREATGGLDTVAVRVPAHPVARRLIELAGVPVSAPSANIFMGLSPTRAEDIEPAIARRLAVILDGGPCQVGIESTVVDLTSDPVRVLRPGTIGLAELERALGVPVRLGEELPERRSPGAYARHYAPRTPVRLVGHLASGQAGLTFQTPRGPNQVRMPFDPAGYARELYARLHELDEAGVDTIFVEEPPRHPAWDGVWNRLRKASQSA